MDFRKLLGRKRRGVTGRSFTIAAFMTALGFAISLGNIVSPFVVQSPTVATAATGPKFWSNMATVTVNGPGGLNATASVPSSGSSISTLLIFGDFYAGLKFMASTAIAVVLPGYYVGSWMTQAGIPLLVSAGLAALFQSLVWYSYSVDYFYILANRQLAQQ